VAQLRGDFVTADAVSDVRVSRLEHDARLALRRGQRDSWGWPGVARLVPVYMQEFEPAHRLVEYDGVRFGTIADLESVRQSQDPVTVVSLCRMGDDDVPAPHRPIDSGIVDMAEAHPHLTHALAGVADLIDDRAGRGESVFVHCVRAETRTPSVYAAWRIRHGGVSPKVALAEASRHFDGPKQDAFRNAVNELTPR
jgi:hypothetical protein